jgi:hypothetical protein
MFHCFRWVPVVRSLSELVSYLLIRTMLWRTYSAQYLSNLCTSWGHGEKISPSIPLQPPGHSVHTMVGVCNHVITFSNDKRFGLVDRKRLRRSDSRHLWCFVSWLQYTIHYKDCALIGCPIPHVHAGLTYFLYWGQNPFICNPVLM